MEPEVEGWLLSVDDDSFGRARLTSMYWPSGVSIWHITYFAAPGWRIVLLAVFVKRKQRERAEIDRAEQAMFAAWRNTSMRIGRRAE